MYGDGPRVAVDCSDSPSRTKQSMKAETDINNIVARYRRTGLLTYVNERSPVYTDVSDVTDYREAVARVEEVERYFGGLPSKLRAEFGNDVATFLDAMTDESPEGRARAVALGLVPAPKEPEVPPVEPAPAQAAPQGRNADGTFK